MRDRARSGTVENTWADHDAEVWWLATRGEERAMTVPPVRREDLVDGESPHIGEATAP
jgi:hypothetical protein